ncbi:ligase [Aureococcus anophagefferens]|nr:ligase [Aureococcus anophagefferens]
MPMASISPPMGFSMVDMFEPASARSGSVARLFSGAATASATAEAITADGWFRTDDLVKVDGDGYLTVLDRATDMIVVCSENVYRVGSARARRAPRVELATVYGMPDDAMGERVKAVVVKQDESLTAAALRRHAAAKLADFKVPSSIEFMARADLPMTGSGKVAKAALRSATRSSPRSARPRASRKQAAQPRTRREDDRRDRGHPAPARRAAFEQEKARVACALEESGEDVAGVVCLTALGAGAALGDDVAGATKAALKTLLALLQALGERDDARVVVATRGAADDASSTASRRRRPTPRSRPAPSGAWSGPRPPRCPSSDSASSTSAPASRAASATPPSSSGSSARRRRRRAPNPPGASACARRPGSRPARARLEAGPSSADVAAGVHVVSGGTGARRRVGREARGRRRQGRDARPRRAALSPSSPKLAKLASDTGATVVVEQADVSLASGAEALLARGAALKPTPATKLRVWHLAGVVDGAAPALTWDRFADVLKPKVDGSLHLHAAS